MKKIISTLLSVIMLLTLTGGLVMSLSSCGKGTAYYISATDGNDENDGLSEKSPWKTFANVNSRLLEPGDKVLLKRGDVFHGRLEIRGSGEENAWITVSNYGDKAKELPIITMDQDKNDIAVLVTDLNDNVDLKYRKQINYICFDGLDIRNSWLGIYFRFVVTKGNTGFVVKNCNFKNMYNYETFANELKSLDDYVAWMHSPKGNLPKINFDLLRYDETGGGADEYIWPDAIRFGGKSLYNEAIIKEVDVHNCVFENCSGGLHISLTSPDVFYTMATEKVRMYDCVMTGSYNGIYRFEDVDGGWDGTDASEWGYVRNVRHLGARDLYAGVTGPTASYMAVCNNVLVENSEMAYQYNNGNGDGCGFDYETFVRHVTQRNMVYHNNDAEGILMLGGGREEYLDVHLLNSLFYNDLKRPLTTELNWDIMTGSGSDTISFKDIYSYFPRINPADERGKLKVRVIGPAGTKGVKENITTGNLEDYRNHFAFNGTSYESWNYAADGITDVKVENGKLSFTLTKDSGYIASAMPLNLFAYTDCLLQLEGTTASQVAFGYRSNLGTGFTVGDKAEIKDGRASARIKLTDDGSFATGMMLCFYGKAGDKVVIDSVEFDTEYNFSGRLIDGGKTVRVSLSGHSSPFFSENASEQGITVSGLPSGVAVKKISQYDATTLYVELSDSIPVGTELTIKVRADQFIDYFKEMLENLDFGCRTPEQDAGTFDYGEVQTYIKNGYVERTFKVTDKV